jgi:hypothetical protein
MKKTWCEFTGDFRDEDVLKIVKPKWVYKYYKTWITYKKFTKPLVILKVLNG